MTQEDVVALRELMQVIDDHNLKVAKNLGCYPDGTTFVKADDLTHKEYVDKWDSLEMARREAYQKSLKEGNLSNGWANSTTPVSRDELMGLNLANLNHYAAYNGMLHCYMVGESAPRIFGIDTPLAQAILKAVGANGWKDT